MRCRIVVGLLLLLVGLPLGGDGQSGDSVETAPLKDLTRVEFVQPNLGATLDQMLEKYSDSGFSGTVIIGWGGLVALHKGYGLADRERKIACGIDTAYPIGRLTTQFTTVAVLKLVDQGLIELTTPITQVLGPLPEPKNSATVEHLLTHTAGLVADEEKVAVRDRESLLEAIRNTPADFAPGTDHRVSSLGYNLLAMIVDEVSKTSFEEFVRARIFEPFGMNTARFLSDPPVEDSPMAVGYEGGKSALGLIGKLPLPRHGIALVRAHLRSRSRGLKPVPPPAYDWSQRGVEGIVATVGDLFRWEIALRGYRLLSDASKDSLFAARKLPEAYGWRVEKTKRGTNRYHMGSAGNGYATEYLRYERFLRYVDKDLVILFAINNDMGWSKPVWKSIEDRTYGEDYSTPFAILAILVILVLIGGASRRGKPKPRYSRRRGGSVTFGGTGQRPHERPRRRRFR